MNKFAFQSLSVYRMAKALVIMCYRLTRCFPAEEKYAMVQQMNRAAVSIPSNLAEGYSRDSLKDKIRFINMSYGSLMELVCQFEIVFELGYINKEQFDEICSDAYTLAIKLSNFKSYYEKQIIISKPQ